MAFDVRAMENFATAPASPGERTASRWVVALTVVALCVIAPLGTLRLAAVPAFVPAIVGASVLAQTLTALLFYVQYRIARSSQIALLAIVYGASAFLTLFFILTFPNVFSRTGLFHANLQTASYANVVDQMLFATFVLGFAAADRFEIALDRLTIRWIALATAGVVAVTAVASIELPLPALLDPTLHGTPLFNVVCEPIIFATYALGIALLVDTRLQTVTQVWLLVVVLLRVAQLASVSLLSNGRYTVSWYTGRVVLLIAASIMLAVFIVKLNDLLLRLARRNVALTERTEVAELEVAEGESRYRTLANVVPQLIWSATADGEVDYVNDRWVAYTGLDVDETRLLGWRAALDESQPTSMYDAWHESLRSGKPFGGEYRLREAQTEEWRWFLINAIPIRDAAGNVRRWIGSCTDIDQQKRIDERETFLARAGDRLSASLDMHATLDTIADLAIGRMAVWLRVDLLDDDGRFVPVLAASSDAAENTALRELLGHPVSDRLEDLFTIVLARREPVVERERHDLAGPVAGRVRFGASIIVPLTSGDTFLGTLALVRGDVRLPAPDEVAVARDFGRRASQALDHARLYERERSTADALQRAMLPQVMPQLPNVSFSASYSAASESQRVGGDFYDAFTLPDGRVALTIGDVTGHGLEAAVIMGEIRQALRAASFERAEPSTILDRASTLLVASGRSVFVTAVFGVLDAKTGRFEYATAGHPPPLVYDGTRLIRLKTSGLPIGLRDDEGVDFALTLPAECTLVLYTDGLLEFSRDLEEGERRIEAAIRELGVDDIDHLAGAIMKRVLRDDDATDDIAILTATLGALPLRPPYETREWRFHSSDARTATLVRHEIGEYVAAETGRPETMYESELVFGELFSNVVRHAPGSVLVRITNGEPGVSICVIDSGGGFHGGGEATDTFAESGRGLYLVRSLGDDVTIEPGSPGTRITVMFHRATDERSTGSSAELSKA